MAKAKPVLPTIRANWEKWQTLQADTVALKGACVDCIQWSFCSHPVNCVPNLNRVTGDLDYPHVGAEQSRAPGTACGPVGNLFEARPPRSLISRYWGHLFWLVPLGTVACCTGLQHTPYHLLCTTHSAGEDGRCHTADDPRQ